MDRVIRPGTRASKLARWQTDHIADLLQAAWQGLRIETQVITTRGDKLLDTPLPMIGGKGVFTAEIETALRNGDIDCAVHSLKDLPVDPSPGLVIGAIPARAAAGDVLVSQQGFTLETLPQRATVGTSSRRRAAQLLSHRPDLNLLDIRGNIDTRLSKALHPDSPYDAIVLAAAGLERLALMHHVAQVIPFSVMLPAPGQGALAVQCCDDTEMLALLHPIHHLPTAAAVSAERAFLAELGGGCSLPVGAFARITDDNQLHLQGRVVAIDGSSHLEMSLSGTIDTAIETGRTLARHLLAQGADRLLT